MLFIPTVSFYIPFLLIQLSHCYTSIELEDVTIYFPLKIDYLAPFGCATGTSCDDEGAAYIPAAMEVVRELLNEDEDVEVFNNVTVNYIDTKAIEGPKAAAQAAVKNNTVAVMGLSQNCYIQSTILNINKKIGVSDYCQMDLQSVKGFDQTTVLLKSATNAIAKSVMYFLKKYDWTKVAVVSPSTSLTAFQSRARSDLLDALASEGVDILLDSRMDPNSPHDRVEDRIIEESERARIFIICDWSKNANLLRNYLYTVGTTNKMQSGEYFVLAFISYGSNSDWLEAASGDQRLLHFGKEEIGDFNLTENDLHQIYRNLIVMSDGPPPAAPNSIWDDIKKRVLQNAKKKMCPPFCDKNVSAKVSPRWDRIKSLFDAMQYLADSTEEALKYGKNIYDSDVFYEYMISREIKSVTGYSEYIDGFGTAIGSMQIYYFFENQSHNTYSLFPCARLGQSSLLDPIFVLTNYEQGLSVNFVNGTPPTDTPKCGFHNENCGPPPNYTFVIVISIGVGVLTFLVVVAAFLYKRYRFEKKLHSLSFLVDRNRITLKKHINLMSQQSLRSMTSVLRGAGASIIELSQNLRNSHFVLEDYKPNEYGTNQYGGSQYFGGDSSTSILGSSAFRPSGGSGETSDDLRWHALSDFAVGLLEGRVIGLKRIYMRDIDFKREVRKEIAALQETSNPNTIGFLGMVVQSPDVFVVYELAQRGSLKDVLDNDDLQLDDVFMKQMTKDIVAGLEYLHTKSPVGCHGRLKSTNCLIDARWMVRLSSFGLREMRQEENPIREGVQDGKDELWTAPELLRWSTGLAQCSTILVQKADIYSLAIVLYEIFGRAGPWGEEPMEPREIVTRVRNVDQVKKVFRPDLAVIKDAPKSVQVTVAAAWVENPEHRPEVTQIKRKLRPLTTGFMLNQRACTGSIHQKRTIMDNMVAMIEKYTEKLEKDIAERNEELEAEKEKSETLLKMMLPDVVAESLKNGSHVAAESFDCVTVFFSDCPGFVEMSATSKPIEIVDFLNDLYTCFDSIISKFDVYKVETIADAYMVVSGLPIPNGNHHVGEIASLGLALLEAVEDFKIRHRPNEKVRLRIGMNSGPCVAGVVGLKMPRYCLFGDTVNTASRMESNGIPLRINCSESSRRILEDLGGYELDERGLVEMKGKGKQMTYFVRKENPDVRRDRVLKDRVKFPTLKRAIVEEKTLDFL